ncbi:MAG: DUF3883 domain-containing protein [Treponema sp.]|uniref:protein NO VEIN domain-containing protein n=1 Tax=Treponema sp. TaxID=166 RepID=UPI0025F5F09F|nr:DUF3883 domain-containing protein [Treponema sp.]MBR0496444.1 DUF3883 domain-containing protein [Treponema sp.]
MYDINKQYRCDIIRGKSQSQLEDLLPAYAKVINDICPLPKKEFDKKFNENLISYLPTTARDEKTLKNHRTEIAGQLFGMYVHGADDIIYCSDRTKKFLADGDIPAFFKDICYKMQFPNVMQKQKTVEQRLFDGISIRQYCYLISVLEEAEKRNIYLTKKEVGVYVLNSLDALKRNATPTEIVDLLEKDRQTKKFRDIQNEKESSWNWQHINEQINYLELANLVYIDGKKTLYLNHKENETLSLFSKEWNSSPLFLITKEDVSNSENFKKLQLRWYSYYGSLSNVEKAFTTKIEALSVETNSEGGYRAYGNTVELGDEGEKFVFNYEKTRVGKYNPRLVNKVILFGKQKGLGYDIQSVMAVKKIGNNEYPEMGKYIEVKATRRVTAPKIDDSEWYDSVNITRNEWVAAKEKQDSYFIYRVFFTRTGVFIYTMQNPCQKNEDDKLSVIPLTYRIEISKKSVDDVIDIKIENGGENA